LVTATDPTSGDRLDGLAALAELEEHLFHAQQALTHRPFSADDDSAGDHSLSRVFAVVHAALAMCEAAFTERRFPPAGPPRIALVRLGHRVEVWTSGAQDQDIAAFILALRLADARLLACAELLGLVLGLSVKWAAVGFAPPVVLLSLGKSAPRILELGRDLIDR
jgi:hypothetical protein